jgi:hypothetical protein
MSTTANEDDFTAMLDLYEEVEAVEIDCGVVFARPGILHTADACRLWRPIRTNGKCTSSTTARANILAGLPVKAMAGM